MQIDDSGAAFRSRYELHDTLGQGAMGVVYSGTQRSTGRPVAVKFLTRVDEPDYRARFEREGRTLARISHPGVLRVLDVGTEEGRPYMVTELLEGPSLRTLLARRGRLALEEVLELAEELLPALAACHEAGVVHRDLKPENIVFDACGRPRIVDLGIARSEPGLTVCGALLGTPAYIAPEQARGEVAGPAADLYAFGCIVFELLTGRLPYRARTVEELLEQHCAAPVPRLPGMVPPAVAAAVAEAMAKSPAARPASALELLDALQSRRPLRRCAGSFAPTVAPRRIPGWEAAMAACVGMAVVLTVGAVLL